MRFYRTIFQYKNRKGTYSIPSEYNSKGDNPDPGCFYRQVNKIVSQQKTFYITQSISVLSSTYTAHFIKIFSIEDYGLNDTAKLIKTKTGIRNELGYEMDFSTSSNKNTIRGDINYSTEYDPANKIITIPLITEDGKLTARKIRYRFDGKYFVKM